MYYFPKLYDTSVYQKDCVPICKYTCPHMDAVNNGHDLSQSNWAKQFIGNDICV